MSARHCASSSGVGGGGASKRLVSLMRLRVFHQDMGCQAGKNQQIRRLGRHDNAIIHDSWNSTANAAIGFPVSAPNSAFLT
jgi:hypothetical protein